MRKRFVRIIDRLTNSSKVVVGEFDDGGLADTINDIVSRNVQPWSCFIIVIACLVVKVMQNSAIHYQKRIQALINQICIYLKT